MPSSVVRVGVGVCVVSDAHPGCVLLGERAGSHGEGTFAFPGGHLERFEGWAECAVREVAEETGLALTDVHLATVLNAVSTSDDYHYVVVIMQAKSTGEPQTLEPDKCKGWQWYSWHGAGFPANLFAPLAMLRDAGFDPFASAGSSHGAPGVSTTMIETAPAPPLSQ